MNVPPIKLSIRTQAARIAFANVSAEATLPLFTSAFEYRDVIPYLPNNLEQNEQVLMESLAALFYPQILIGFEKQLAIISAPRSIDSKISETTNQIILECATNIAVAVTKKDKSFMASHSLQTAPEQTRIYGRFFAQCLCALLQANSPYVGESSETICRQFRAGASFIFNLVKEASQVGQHSKLIMSSRDAIAQGTSLDDRSIAERIDRAQQESKQLAAKLERAISGIKPKKIALEKKITEASKPALLKLAIDQLEISEKTVASQLEDFKVARRSKDKALTETELIQTKMLRADKKRFEAELQGFTRTSQSKDNLRHRIAQTQQQQVEIIEALVAIQKQREDAQHNPRLLEQIKRKESGKVLDLRTTKAREFRLTLQLGNLASDPTLAQTLSLQEKISGIAARLESSEEDKALSELNSIQYKIRQMKRQLREYEDDNATLEQLNASLASAQIRLDSLREVSPEEMRLQLRGTLEEILHQKAASVQAEWERTYIPAINGLINVAETLPLTTIAKLDRLIQQQPLLRPIDSTPVNRREHILRAFTAMKEMPYLASDNLVVPALIIGHHTPIESIESDYGAVEAFISQTPSPKLQRRFAYSLQILLSSAELKDRTAVTQWITRLIRWEHQEATKATIQTVQHIKMHPNQLSVGTLDVIWDSALAWNAWAQGSASIQSISRKEQINLRTSLLAVAARSGILVDAFTLEKVEKALLKIPEGRKLSDPELFFYRYGIVLGDQSWRELSSAARYLSVLSSAAIIPPIITDNFHATYGFIAAHPAQNAKVIETILREKNRYNSVERITPEYLSAIYDSVQAIANLHPDEPRTVFTETIYDMLIDHPTLTWETFNVNKRAPKFAAAFAQWRFDNPGLSIPQTLLAAIPLNEKDAKTYYSAILTNPDFLAALSIINPSSNGVAAMVAQHLKEKPEQSESAALLIIKISDQLLNPEYVKARSPSALELLREGLSAIAVRKEPDTANYNEISPTLTSLTRTYGGPEAVPPLPAEQMLRITLKEWLDKAFTVRKKLFTEESQNSRRAVKRYVLEKFEQSSLESSPVLLAFIETALHDEIVSKPFFDTLSELIDLMASKTDREVELHKSLEQIQFITEITQCGTTASQLHAAFEIILAELRTELQLPDLPIHVLLENLRKAFTVVEGLNYPDRPRKQNSSTRAIIKNSAAMIASAQRMFSDLEACREVGYDPNIESPQTINIQKWTESLLPRGAWERSFDFDQEILSIRDGLIADIPDFIPISHITNQMFRKSLIKLFRFYEIASDVHKARAFLEAAMTLGQEASSERVLKDGTVETSTNLIDLVTERIKGICQFKSDISIEQISNVVERFIEFLAKESDASVPIETTKIKLAKISISVKPGEKMQLKVPGSFEVGTLKELLDSIWLDLFPQVEVVTQKPVENPKQAHPESTFLNQLNRLYRAES